jgi:hypothetical protein
MAFYLLVLNLFYYSCFLYVKLEQFPSIQAARPEVLSHLGRVLLK